MSANIQVIDGGVTSAIGFTACGLHVGLRRKRKDLALVMSEVPAVCAAAFTTNLMKGAPIVWNQQVLEKRSEIRAIVVNSAYANSGTGVPGIVHAGEMAATTANCLGLETEEVLVASTGLIGVHLPIEIVKAGIRAAAPHLAADRASATAAAEAITTTDTFLKQMAVSFEIGGKPVTLGAMAKGSGMVHPNMATTLGFLTTDLCITAEMLNKALQEVIAETFNMVSVDGDTSTNDMVVVLANGASQNQVIAEESEDYNIFLQALKLVMRHLARSIAQDGEGATKLIEVTVSGAVCLGDARKLAKSVITSNLVKAAVFAEDANWGRIVAALGSSGACFDYNALSISISSTQGRVPLLVEGMPYWLDDQLCRQILAAKEVQIDVIVGQTGYAATAWGCDLTYDYIRKNGNYRASQNLTGHREQGHNQMMEILKPEGVAC